MDRVFRFDFRAIPCAGELPPAIDEEVDRLFAYQPWNSDQTARGVQVRESLADAFKALLVNVPPCATRTIALRHILDARLQANSAITWDGAY